MRPGRRAAARGHARVGFAKPDPRIYRAAAELAGVAVERCLFVDDSAENVAAAGALGMTGHHHVDPADLRALLRSGRAGSW
ncbi:HAD-IA family hydrolase [Actinophytocola gossypii]|uniref:HAD-IA family hydrolase n=1 Tax=Actinophytocola gossypii TaxID=2812003 RepID=A0ABT2JC01_9PSEU|nr:HAD-IA family hydrolase [Actinophytocola gossypii]MCT2585392.1 HAD-IA family hydrolase [Actinophytocola gossypii]